MKLYKRLAKRWKTRFKNFNCAQFCKDLPALIFFSIQLNRLRPAYIYHSSAEIAVGKKTAIFNYFVYRIFHVVIYMYLIVTYLGSSTSPLLFEFWILVVLCIYSGISFLVLLRSTKRRKENFAKGLPGPVNFCEDPPLLPRNRKKVNDIEVAGNQVEIQNKSGVELRKVKRKQKKERNKKKIGWLFVIWLLFNLACANCVVASMGYLIAGFQPYKDNKTEPLSEGFPLFVPLSLSLILLELFTVGFPLRIMHFIYPISLTSVYILCTFIIFKTSKGKRILYSNLNWNKNTNAAVFSVLLILWVFLTHIILVGLVHVRDMVVLFIRTMNKQKRIKEQLYKDIEEDVDDIDEEEYKTKAEKLERMIQILAAQRHLKRTIIKVFDSNTKEFIYKEVPAKSNIAQTIKSQLQERQTARAEKNAKLEKGADENLDWNDPRMPLKEWWFENLDLPTDEEKVMGRIPAMRNYPFNFPREAKPRLSRMSREMLESFGYKNGVPEEHHLRLVQYHKDVYLIRVEPMSEAEELRMLEIRKKEAKSEQAERIVIEDYTDVELDRNKTQKAPEILVKAAGLRKNRPVKLRDKTLQ